MIRLAIPAIDERHRESRDQRVDPQHGRHEPVHEPDEQRGADAERDRKPGVVVLRDLGRGDGGQRVDGPDREVDPARDEDERPGGGDDQRRRLLVEDVEQVDLREERAARQREGDEQRDEREQDAEAPRDARVEPGRDVERRALTPALILSAPRTPPRGSPPRSARSPASSATIRPRRMTTTRCASPRISSSSDEISRIPMPDSASRPRMS